MKLSNTLTKLEAGEDTVIAALGDSLTQGWMCPKGYLDFLEEMIRTRYPKSSIRYINGGVPGNTARDGLARLDGHILIHQPHLILIQFALNDAYMGISPQAFKRDILSIIERIEFATDAEIALVTSTLINDTRENPVALTFYEVLEEIGRTKKIVLAPVHRYWQEQINRGVPHESLVQGDLVHPTVEGYRLMAEAIMEIF